MTTLRRSVLICAALAGAALLTAPGASADPDGNSWLIALVLDALP